MSFSYPARLERLFGEQQSLRIGNSLSVEDRKMFVICPVPVRTRAPTIGETLLRTKECIFSLLMYIDDMHREQIALNRNRDPKLVPAYAASLVPGILRRFLVISWKKGDQNGKDHVVLNCASVCDRIGQKCTKFKGFEKGVYTVLKICNTKYRQPKAFVTMMIEVAGYDITLDLIRSYLVQNGWEITSSYEDFEKQVLKSIHKKSLLMMLVIVFMNFHQSGNTEDKFNEFNSIVFKCQEQFKKKEIDVTTFYQCKQHYDNAIKDIDAFNNVPYTMNGRDQVMPEFFVAYAFDQACQISFFYVEGTNKLKLNEYQPLQRFQPTGTPPAAQPMDYVPKESWNDSFLADLESVEVCVQQYPATIEPTLYEDDASLFLNGILGESAMVDNRQEGRLELLRELLEYGKQCEKEISDKGSLNGSAEDWITITKNLSDKVRRMQALNTM